MTTRLRHLASLLLLTLACGLTPLACSDDADSGAGAEADAALSDTGASADVAAADSSASEDAAEDSASAPDTATAEDTASPEDTTTEDTATPEDTATIEDTATAEDTTAEDTTAEDTITADTATEDTATPEDTATEDTEVAEDTTTAEDTTEADAGDPYAGRPIGQCATNADCPEGPQGRSCQRSAPGGICGGCGTDDHCPGVAECSQFGSCGIACAENAECPPGMTCATATGLCRIQSCVDGVCPTPLFGCSSGNQCARVACAQQSDCPAQTTCTEGLCVEDRALR